MIEELKMIIDLLSQATGSAKDFGMFWLCIQSARVVFAYTLGGIVILLSYRIIRSLTKSYDDDRFAASLRSIVCPQKNYGHMMADEKASIIKYLKLGMETEKNNS